MNGKLYIGSMSGTSADGLDLAILQTDGTKIIRMCGGSYTPYPDELRLRTLAAMKDIEAGELLLLSRDIAIFNENAIKQLLISQSLKPEDISAIGFHGQTIRHMPKQGVTMQAGNPAILAHLTGIDVIADFRSSDLAAGGQGAPLIPIFHQALAQYCGYNDVVFLNIGGVSNITYVGSNTLIAYDVGPGNAGMDDMVHQHTGARYDDHGSIASTGKVYGHALDKLIAKHLKQAQERASLDRNQFDYSCLEGLNLPDKLATMAEFCAHAICLGVRSLPMLPNLVIAAGGGVHNKHLLERIKKHLAPINVIIAIESGLESDLLEAYAFAYLAARRIANLPISFPNTTGVGMPQCGGAIYKC
ncbi:MAG: anhydro-N-acetylmuramic acid kinase [Proteobacteria bacterium]|nr:anhydro-N-acetylmuramic acid kinase [Pseudomonadota bacterium]